MIKPRVITTIGEPEFSKEILPVRPKLSNHFPQQEKRLLAFLLPTNLNVGRGRVVYIYLYHHTRICVWNSIA